jgi:hypothetical protein
MNASRRAAHLHALVAGLLFAFGAGAQTPIGERPLRLDYRIGLGLEHSDNIERSAIAPVSDQIAAADLAFTLTSDSERLSLAAAGAAEFFDYLDESFDSELRTRLGLNAEWRILPGRLSWAFEDSLGRQPVDAFDIDRPDNQQRTNVLITGPTLSLRPSANSRLLAELRYIDTYAQRTEEFNGDRLSLALRGLRQLSPRTDLSVHAEFAEADFERVSASAEPFRRSDAYLRIDRRTAALEWSVDLGASRIRFDDAPRRSSALLRVRAAFDGDGPGRIELSGGREFSDAAADLAFAAPRLDDYALPLGLPTLRTSFLSADVYRADGIELAAERTLERLYLRAEGYWRDLDYLRSDSLDQRLRGFTVGASRSLRPRLLLGVFAAADWRDYRSDRRSDREDSLGLSLRWQWLRNLSLELSASRTSRISSVPAPEFRDRRYGLRLIYTRR